MLRTFFLEGEVGDRQLKNKIILCAPFPPVCHVLALALFGLLGSVLPERPFLSLALPENEKKKFQTKLMVSPLT